MSDTEQEIQWYIARDGKQHGPLSETEMRLFVKGNHLKQSDLLWKPGFPDWKPAQTVFPPTPKNPTGNPAQPATPKGATKTKPDNTQRSNDTASQGSNPNASTNAQASTGKSPQPETPSTDNLSSRKQEPTSATRQTSPHDKRVQAKTSPANAQGKTSPSTSPNDSTASTPVKSGSSIDPAAPGASTPQAKEALRNTPIQGYGQPQSGRQSQAGARQRANPAEQSTDKTVSPSLAHSPDVRTQTNSGSGTTGIQWALSGAIAIFVGGAAYFGYTYSDQLSSIAQTTMSGGMATSSRTPPVVTSKSDTKTAAKPTPVTPAPTPAAPPTTKANVSIDNLDSQFQKSALWALLKSEYPEWYSARLQQAINLNATGNDPEVTKKLLAEIVALRRKHAANALAATPGKLEGIAAAFLSNLKRLSEHSTEACYTFISKGELSPQVVDLMTSKTYGPAFETQATMIFEAISEGRKSPIKRERANKDDYNVLAKQLGTMGWTQKDLQLFANPQALAAAPPATVCKLVQDWFAAHIALSNTAVKDRLLSETLRPVVTG